MSAGKTCPKCRGTMVQGSKANLEGNFGCTRPEPNPETPHRIAVQAYYCASCGYLEFYRALAAKEKEPPTLIEDADRASELHRKETKG